MSHLRKIAARIHAEPTERLPRLARLYATDARASRLILQELLRRQQTQAGTYTISTT